MIYVAACVSAWALIITLAVACGPVQPGPISDAAMEAEFMETDAMDEASWDTYAPEDSPPVVHTCPPWCPTGNQPPNKNQ